jgi:hypothetical protein
MTYDDQFHYPVIVTVEHTHVVWVTGDTQKDAVESIKNDGAWYENINDQETLASTGVKMAAPDEWDWDNVYEGDYFGSYAPMQCDEHVQTHTRHLRAEAMKACASAGHPGSTPHAFAKDLISCPVCWTVRIPAEVTP